MITFKCGLDHYNEIRDFAKEIGKEKEFSDVIGYLDTYSCKYWEDGEEKYDRARTNCELFSDFAPHSFSFVIKKRNKEGKYEFWMNGGLIFHKSDQSWSVHT